MRDKEIEKRARRACGCRYCHLDSSFHIPACSAARIERALVEHEKAVREENSEAIQELLNALSKVQDWDGTRVGAAMVQLETADGNRAQQIKAAIYCATNHCDCDQSDIVRGRKPADTEEGA